MTATLTLIEVVQLHPHFLCPFVNFEYGVTIASQECRCIQLSQPRPDAEVNRADTMQMPAQLCLSSV